MRSSRRQRWLTWPSCTRKRSVEVSGTAPSCTGPSSTRKRRMGRRRRRGMPGPGPGPPSGPGPGPSTPSGPSPCTGPGRGQPHWRLGQRKGRGRGQATVVVVVVVVVGGDTHLSVGVFPFVLLSSVRSGRQGESLFTNKILTADYSTYFLYNQVEGDKKWSQELQCFCFTTLTSTKTISVAFNVSVPYGESEQWVDSCRMPPTA